MPFGYIKDKLLDNFFTFKIVRFLFSGSRKTIKIVKRELSHKKDEKILDVGCGLGNYSQVTNGFYVGADLNKSFVKFASQKYGRHNKYFAIFDAERMCFKKKSFHKTLFMSMLHHFPNSVNTKILKEIKRVTREEVIILDLNPKTENLFIKFFYFMDRGHYIRTLEKQIFVINKSLKIKKILSFISGTSLHSLFICQPKK